MNTVTPTPAQVSRALEGKVALVTGASSGIGRASALELSRRGAKVVVAARRREELDTLVDAIRTIGADAAAITVDVTREDDIKAMIKFAVDTYGHLDIAFNDAGTEGVFAPLLEQDAARFDMVFEPNVRGVFNSMKYEAEVMLAQGAGSIINNASMGAVIGFENASLYIATKTRCGRHDQDGVDRVVPTRSTSQFVVPRLDRDTISSSRHLAFTRSAASVCRGHACGPLRQR
jgi:NADP-dependent 3-hydroxy acid dehydrogenase YdfG